ncbi:MAG: hypothetical protein ABI346_03870 [Candidatus Baltobacteraceae bacterium]
MTPPIAARHFNDARLIGINEGCRTSIDRVPFAYEHSLSGMDLFGFDALCALAEKYDRDYFVTVGAPSPATKFYAVDQRTDAPHTALMRLESGKNRVLLKRPENVDPRYRDLMQALFAQVRALMEPSRGNERVVRLDSSILISSAATITPFHFDPEVSFFFQIEGEKRYHPYSPTALSEPELEGFYRMGIVNIGQVDFQGRDHAQGYTFRLSAGKGMHQPQNSPHWVETGSSRSISYVFSFETERSRALGRTRAFNYYLRKAGFVPALPGARPTLDSTKAGVMQIAIPMRKALGAAVRPFKSRGTYSKG